MTQLLTHRLLCEPQTGLILSPEAVITAARETLGARWRHQGRSIETGIDCLGVLMWTAHRCARYLEHDFRLNPEFNTYSLNPDGVLFRRILSTFLKGGYSMEEARPSDIAFIKFPGKVEPQHVGVLTPSPPSVTDPLSILHAHYSRNHTIQRVIEEPFRRWRPYTVEIFRFHELDF